MVGIVKVIVICVHVLVPNLTNVLSVSDEPYAPSGVCIPVMPPFAP